MTEDERIWATVALALALSFTLLVPAKIGNLSFMSPARGQPAALTKPQSDTLNTYNNTVNDFRSILGQRRTQINSNQRIPNLPGQALYLRTGSHR